MKNSIVYLPCCILLYTKNKREETKMQVRALISWHGEDGDERLIVKGNIYDGEFEPKYKEMMVSTSHGQVALQEGEWELVTDTLESIQANVNSGLKILEKMGANPESIQQL